LSAYIAPDLQADHGPRSRLQHENARAGGVPIEDIVRMGEAVYTLAIGEHMREPAEHLARRAQVPFSVLPTWTGLEASDELVGLLSQISGVTAPAPLRRERELLIDAYLTSYYLFSDKRIAIASDPDLLFTLAQLVHSLGAQVVSAVSSTSRPRVLKHIPIERVSISDLGEFEDQARSAQAQLLLTHSHGRDAAARLGVPLYRVGFPIVDRLGAQDRCWLGYAGTRRLVFDLANQLQPRSWTDDLEDELIPAPRA
jgi:nitrogenase molybdenum-iron protein NifN